VPYTVSPSFHVRDGGDEDWSSYQSHPLFVISPNLVWEKLKFNCTFNFISMHWGHSGLHSIVKHCKPCIYIYMDIQKIKEQCAYAYTTWNLHSTECHNGLRPPPCKDENDVL